MSHAVGCAFAACLEKKQKREKETGVSVTYDRNRTTFYREGSFRVQTLTEQKEKANEAKTSGKCAKFPAVLKFIEVFVDRHCFVIRCIKFDFEFVIKVQFESATHFSSLIQLLEGNQKINVPPHESHHKCFSGAAVDRTQNVEIKKTIRLR